MLLNFLYDHMYPYPGVKCIRNKSKGETIMNDMQFAKYSCDIREILGNMTEKDQFANLVRMLSLMQYQTVVVKLIG